MTPIRVETEREGQIVRLTLARPRGNVLDAAMVGALRAALAEISATGPLKLLILDHEGPHFSFGASVEEHLPERVASMLGDFHALIREIEGMGVPTAATLHGQCLGGGLELAIVAGRVFADPTTWMGVPEVKLGVFPPVGAVLLPFRVPMATAVDLVLSGSSLDAADSLAAGLCDVIDVDPRAACLAWFDAQLAPHSAAAVRQGWRAVRRPIARALADDLAAVEAQYLTELMALRDPVEGLTAFVQHRPPTWEHA